MPAYLLVDQVRESGRVLTKPHNIRAELFYYNYLFLFGQLCDGEGLCALLKTGKNIEAILIHTSDQFNEELTRFFQSNKRGNKVEFFAVSPASMSINLK